MGNSQVYKPAVYSDKIEAFEARGHRRPHYTQQGPQPYYPDPIRNNRKGVALGHHHHHAAAPAGYGVPEYGPVYAAPVYGYAPPAYGYPFAV